MRHLPTRLLCLIAAFTLAEGPVVVMQGWAWCQMLNDRIPERGVAEAVDSTFSGAEPCEHCKRISEEEAEKKREEAPIPELSPLAKAVASSQKVAILKTPDATFLPFILSRFSMGDQFTADLPVPPPDMA